MVFRQRNPKSWRTTCNGSAWIEYIQVVSREMVAIYRLLAIFLHIYQGVLLTLAKWYVIQLFFRELPG
jgi:hypothetical protein